MKKTFLVLICSLALANTQECGPSELYCYLSGGCIPKTNICNGFNDCSIGEDELFCFDCVNRFPCLGECIPHEEACNGFQDCAFGTDEGLFCHPGENTSPGNVTAFNCLSQSAEARIDETYVRSVVPFGDADLVFLDHDSEAIEPGCPSRYENGVYIAESPYGLCAAERTEEGGEIVEKYKVLISSGENDGPELINLNFARAVIDFECRYQSEATLTLEGPLTPVLTLLQVDIGSQHAEFTLKMARYTSFDFSAISTDNNILQGSTVYIALTLEGAYGLALQATSCTASAYEDGSGPSIPLLIEGCPDFLGPASLGVQLHPQESLGVFAFSFNGFMWNPLPDEGQSLWISCTATVCPEEPGSCLRPCIFEPLVKRRRSVVTDKNSETSTSLSLGPFNFESPTCDEEWLGCSHQCEVNDKGEGVCTCPAGFMLLDDGRTCYEGFLLLNENSLAASCLVLFLLVVILAGAAMLARRQVIQPNPPTK